MLKTLERPVFCKCYFQFRDLLFVGRVTSCADESTGDFDGGVDGYNWKGRERSFRDHDGEQPRFANILVDVTEDNAVADSLGNASHRSHRTILKLNPSVRQRLSANTRSTFAKKKCITSPYVYTTLMFG